jgi:sirohydrochlorin cobaltochelatase
MTMAAPMTGALLILPDELPQDVGRQLAELSHAFAARLGQPVVSCVLGEAGEAVAAGLRQLVAFGVRQIVAIPLLLSPDQNRNRRIFAAIQWASRRWPFLTFHPASATTWQEWAGLVRATARDALVRLGTPPGETGVLIAGPGGLDPLVNADLARLAHLAFEAGEFARVDYAFLDTARPSVAGEIAWLASRGLRNFVLVPWLLSAGDTLKRLSDQGEQAARQRDLRLTVALSPSGHSGFIDVLISRFQSALADDSLLVPSWDQVLSEIAQGGGRPGHGQGRAGGPEDEAQLQELERRINELLPLDYQGRYEDVSSRPMGTARLKFSGDGSVAWDEIWTSFCDLALAGGPSHRGTLLEAVLAADALAEPAKYEAVVAEIERGIKMVTGLPTVPSKVPGWVGVGCDSEEMAIWLMRAIIVENVMVRREADVLYLPAGPQFTLNREIKNVVTVMAKTCHYWSAHILARRRRPVSTSVGAID